MFALDTNVFSELRKARTGRANQNVVNWAARTSPLDMFLPAIVILELELGILKLERRDAEQAAMLRVWFEHQVLRSFADRILPIDLNVVRRCAPLHLPRSLPERDALIAATALVHGLTVVTRNVKDFERTGARVLNPWDA